MKLSRRTMLRGAGAALGLPWLEAMAPSNASAAPADADAPVRMAVLYLPNGVHQDLWTPDVTGRNFGLKSTLDPLNPFQQSLLVLTNLWNEGSKGSEGHYIKSTGFLTSTTATKTVGVDVSCNGISMDQVAAQKAGRITPLPSLELGIAPVTTGVDKNVGYTRVYGSHIAWGGPSSPLARETNPRYVFERLFRAAHPKAEDARRDTLLLDRVLDDASVLRGQLGVADRQRMDEYLSIVRSLEERITRANLPERTSWKLRAPLDPAGSPEGIPKQFAEHVRLMMDMTALAFQTDTTRIVTFMFGNEVTSQDFSFLDGVKGGHHNISHHKKEEDALRMYQIITRWHVEQYAYLLSKLRSAKEGERSVLDNSMILFGAGIRDGNAHDPHNLPIVLAGRAGGRLDSGQHLSYAKDTPLSNLYVTMLEAFGTPVDRHADSTGPLPGVLA